MSKDEKPNSLSAVPGCEQRISELVTQATKIGQAAQQDDRALNKQINRYAMPCRGYILAAMKHSDVAEDAAQDFILEKLATGYIFTKFKPGRGRFRDFLKTSLRHHVTSAFQTLARNHRRHTELTDEFTEDSASWSAEFDRLFLRTVIAEILDQAITECSTSGKELRWMAFRDYYLDGSMSWNQVDKRHNLAEGQASNLAESMVRMLRTRFRQHRDHADIMEIYQSSTTWQRKLEFEVNEDEAFVLGTLRALDHLDFSETDLLNVLKTISKDALKNYKSIVALNAKPEKLKAARKYFRMTREEVAVEPERKLACEILIHAATARAEVEFATTLSTVGLAERANKYAELARAYPALRVADWFGAAEAAQPTVAAQPAADQ